MNLTLLVPREVLVDREVAKIVAEAPNGFFCLLPRHVDVATALVPGILAFTTPEGEEVFAAVDDGILVKQGASVEVSTLNAVVGEALGRLEETVNRQFRERDEQERRALRAVRRIEIGLVRRFLDMRPGT